VGTLEAKEILRRVKYVRDRYYFYGEETVTKDCEALDKAISAVKKTIPQKVTHEATLYKCCTCPNCKNVVDKFTDFLGEKVRVRIKYCNFCGQALDWSKE
jgi:hypothetical protein